MKFIRSLTLVIILCIVLNSCSSLSEAGKIMRNEKTNSADEFLVEKREPLSQPPDFKNIPVPGSVEKKKERSIEEMIKKNNSEPDIIQRRSSSTEESILNQIKK